MMSDRRSEDYAFHAPADDYSTVVLCSYSDLRTGLRGTKQMEQ